MIDQQELHITVKNPANMQDKYYYSAVNVGGTVIGIRNIRNQNGVLAPTDLLPDWVVSDMLNQISVLQASSIFSNTNTTPWSIDYYLEYDETTDEDNEGIDTHLIYNSHRSYLLGKIVYSQEATTFDPNQVGVDNQNRVFYQETGTDIELADQTLEVPSGMSLLSTDLGTSSELLGHTGADTRLSINIDGTFYAQRFTGVEVGVLIILSRLV